MSKLEGINVYLSRKAKIAGARRYAQADKADPFAFNRAMTHIKQGMAEEGDYNAEHDGAGGFHSVKRL